MLLAMLADGFLELTIKCLSVKKFIRKVCKLVNFNSDWELFQIFCSVSLTGWLQIMQEKGAMFAEHFQSCRKSRQNVMVKKHVAA